MREILRFRSTIAEEYLVVVKRPRVLKHIPKNIELSLSSLVALSEVGIAVERRSLELL
jgi:hypothetical protein